MALISVIIPTYDRPAFVARAVQSVLAQTWRDLEVIVVDDHSPAPVAAVLKDINDPRLTVLRQESNQGAPAARNAGIRKARGEFLFLLDDDDELLPEALTHLMARMAVAPSSAGVVAGGMKQVDGQGRLLRTVMPRLEGNIRSPLLRGEKDSNVMGLVRRECFDRAGLFDEALPCCQDWDIWLRIAEHYEFAILPEVIAVYHCHGAQISSDPARLIRGREQMVAKHHAVFAQEPGALAIHLKRLGKMEALNGSWHRAAQWFTQAAETAGGREWFYIAAWALLEYPFQRLYRRREAAGAFLVVALALLVTFFALQRSLADPYIVNDDVRQHIWWMRIFRDPSLFPHDLLLRYAASLQNVGILALYRIVALVMDPLWFTKILPFALMPVSAWALYRLVMALTADIFTAVLTAVAFLVTPLYIAQMGGGHAHVFGFPILILFLYFFTASQWRAAGAMILAGVFFFPIVAVLAAGMWALSFPARRKKWSLNMHSSGMGEWLVAVVAAVVVLIYKFWVLSDPVLGVVLPRDQVMRMPELTALGRWEVWPVEPLGRAWVRLGEMGVFVFKGGWKSALPHHWKEWLLLKHYLFFGLSLVCAGWWVFRRQTTRVMPLVLLALTSVVLYEVAAAVLLRMYAPDRYVEYSAAILTLLFLMIPLGMTVSACKPFWARQVLQAAVIIGVLASVPLGRGGDLLDHSGYRSLYGFLRTLPKDALIAAYPDDADGIPLFTRRSVLVNKELSVPLYDRYWMMMTARTRDFFRAYYAGDMQTVRRVLKRQGVTHLVIDRRQFTPEFLKGPVYFEPFNREIKASWPSTPAFALAGVPANACVWTKGDFCVIAIDPGERP